MEKDFLKEFNGQYMTVDELALYIKRSRGAIRNLVLRRVIPYRKPAGRLIFLKEEIDQWVQDAPGKKLEEIQNNLWDRESFKSSIKRT
jgi:excisionase family DNA binding protein